MPSINDIVHGEDFIIEVLVDATYKVILCATDGVLRYQQEVITTTTEDSGIWKSKAPRLNEVSLSVSGLTPIEDSATHVSWFYMMGDAVRTVPQTIRATFTNENGESRVISGSAIIASGEITGTADDFASSTIEFEFSGAVQMTDDDPGTSPTQLATPELTLSDVTDSSMTASWPAVTNATGYKLLRAAVNDIAFATVIYSGTDLSKISTRLTPDTTYYFWLLAQGSGAYSNSEYDTANATTDSVASTAVTLPAPSFSMIADGDTIVIGNWGSVANADSYEYYFGTTDVFGSASLEYSGTNLTKTKTGLTASTTYYGWVKAVGDGVDYLDSPYATASVTTEAFDPEATTYDTILTNPGMVGAYSDEDEGIHAFFGIGDDKEFHFNAITPLSGTNIRLGIKVSGSAAAVIDFPGDYAGQPFKYIHSDLTEYFDYFPTFNDTINF
jgi:predicted secreted protein